MLPQKTLRARDCRERDDAGAIVQKPAAVCVHERAPPLRGGLALIVAGGAGHHMGELKFGQLARKLSLVAAPVGKNDFASNAARPR